MPNHDVTAVIRKHSRSFSNASRLLPAEIRGDVQKLYAWCRWCDDAVDSTHDVETAREQLAALRNDVSNVYQNRPCEIEASGWLAELATRHTIPQCYPLALLDAMEMDLRLGHIQDQNALLEYCYGAAGVVGLMLCQIFGATDARARKPAESLGIAMQLTNIARDVLEDASRGRCYIPKTWLSTGINSASNQSIARCVRKILDLADRHYKLAEAGMHFLPKRIRPSIRVAAAVYRDIGIEIRRRDYCVMQGRITTSTTRFFTTAVTAFLKGVAVDTIDTLAFAGSPKPAITRHLRRFLPRENDMRNEMKDAKYLAWLGLSLTAFMGGALFLLVLLNPKDDSYSYLPLAYALSCFVFGIVANLLAKQNETPEPVVVKVVRDHD